MLYYVRCGGRNTCEPSGNVSCPKIFVNTIVDDVYSIKLTWIDLMNGNSMDIQQIIRILSQSLNLVIWNSILESAMSVKKQQRLMMARLDVWWWGLSCWVVSCVGSTKQKMMVHFFSDFVVQLWQFFFYEMIQTGRKPVLLSAIFALFIFWGPLHTALWPQSWVHLDSCHSGRSAGIILETLSRLIFLPVY